MLTHRTRKKEEKIGEEIEIAAARRGRASADTLDLRPAVLVTSELVCSCSSSLFHPPQACHFTLPYPLQLSTPSFSARETLNQTAHTSNTVSAHTAAASSEGFPYTSRNKESKSEFQSLTLVRGPLKLLLGPWDPSPLLPSHPSLLLSPLFLLLSSSLSYYWGWPASQPWTQWPRNPLALTVPVLLAAGRLSLCLPEWPRRNEVPWSHHAEPIVFTLMHTV